MGKQTKRFWKGKPKVQAYKPRGLSLVPHFLVDVSKLFWDASRSTSIQKPAGLRVIRPALFGWLQAWTRVERIEMCDSDILNIFVLL